MILVRAAHRAACHGSCRGPSQIRARRDLGQVNEGDLLSCGVRPEASYEQQCSGGPNEHIGGSSSNAALYLTVVLLLCSSANPALDGDPVRDALPVRHQATDDFLLPSAASGSAVGAPVFVPMISDSAWIQSSRS